MLGAVIKCINFFVFSLVKMLVVQIKQIKVITERKKKPADPAIEISLIVSFSLSLCIKSFAFSSNEGNCSHSVNEERHLKQVRENKGSFDRLTRKTVCFPKTMQNKCVKHGTSSQSAVQRKLKLLIKVVKYPGHRQAMKPIRTRCRYVRPALRRRGKTRVRF